MNKKLKLTWRDVLDCDAPNHVLWGHVNEFLLVVKASGYKYFNWNGKIYEFIPSDTTIDTGITVDEL